MQNFLEWSVTPNDSLRIKAVYTKYEIVTENYLYIKRHFVYISMQFGIFSKDKDFKENSKPQTVTAFSHGYFLLYWVQASVELALYAKRVKLKDF